MRLSTRYIQSQYVFFFMIFIAAPLNTPLDGLAQTTTSTNIQVTSTYVQPSVTRLGINLGDQTSYDSGQMMKNLIFSNSGFEGMKYRSVLHCVTVTENTCMDGNTYSDQPNGFWTGATYLVVSGAQSGVAGNVVSNVMIPENCSSACGQQLITFDRSVSLAVGDYVVVTNNLPGDAQEGWGTSLSGAATVETDLNDLSPETPGKQALQINAIGANDAATITHAFDTTNGHTFIQMNGTYTVTFRAKSVGGTNILNVNLERLTPGWKYFLNQNVTLTPNWADYSLTFNAEENGSAIGPVVLNFQVAHAAVLLDDVSLTQTNSDPTNTTAFRDDVVNTLKALQPGTLRMNTTAAIGADLYDQIATPFARYREGAFTNSAVASNIPYGIGEFLQLCAAVGADPWLTIPTATTPQEMTDFMDYVLGSGSTTYSAIRVAQGQVVPWTTVFNTIHIELGNETWNYGFQGDTMVAPAYPLWANQVFGAARKSPNFDPAKFDLVLSGFAADPGYSKAVLQSSTQQDSIDIAPYFAYTVNTASAASMFQALFAEPEWLDTPGGFVYQNAAYAIQQMTSASGTAKPTKISVYEVNLSTLSGTITQAQTNQFVPSVGAGVALADHMLQMMRLGVSTQNSFALPGFENPGANGNTVPVYGLVVDMGPNNYRRPSFLAEALANTAIQGSMLATVMTGANPTWNQPLSTDGVVLSAAHEIQSFAFLNGTSHSLVLFNLSVSNSLPVTFSGPNAPSGTVRVSQLTSANITDDNETSNTVQTTTTTASISSTVPYNLPPYSMTVLSWTGPGTLTGPAQAAAPVFGLAAGTYSTPQSVTISDSTQGAVIYYTTNGTTPTTASTQYTGPITVGLSQTIQAIAVVPFYLNSPVASAAYTIQAQNLSFSGGFAASTGQMILNGNAQLSGSALVLTNGTEGVAGTAWYHIPANVQSFTNDFTFQLANAAANGFTFTIQNQGTAANGMWGPGLGYEYITPSVAIKFDLFTTTGAGSIGIFTEGTLPENPSIDLQTTGINLHDSHAKAVHMVYDGTNLVMTITDTVNNKSYTTTFPINIPTVVGSNSGLVGFTGATGGQTATQEILTWSFSSSGSLTTATPTFSVAPGTYTTAQTVTIADATPGATIYYTTNGTTPTTSSTKYTAPITINSTETVEAVAVATITSGSSGTSSAAATTSTSAVATATYTISTILPTPTFIVAAGTYATAQTVTITDATSGATIYYTTNGTTPTASSTKYTGALAVSATETIEAIAVATGYTNSAVATAAYTIGNPKVAMPTFSEPGGAYGPPQAVQLADATADATIYYTTDGTTPTAVSPNYWQPIYVGRTQTIKAIAIAPGPYSSAVATATYTIGASVAATPTFSVAAGSYSAAQAVTITDATSGATIYYTTNRTTPTTSSTRYTGAITVSATETIEAIAVATGYTNSAVATAAYTIGVVLPTPTFSVAAGTYKTAQTVTISDATSGTTIYYTTNGMTPTTSSTKYTGAITVSSTETIEAMAVATGHTNSAVAMAAYTIGSSNVAAPTFSEPGGAYGPPQAVQLADSTAGATIYYTTDGSTPTASSPNYWQPIYVGHTQIIKAIAILVGSSGSTSSAVVTATYTIGAAI